MSEEDLKSVLAAYQQKAFELFNQNIVLETQVNNLNRTVTELMVENESLKRTKKTSKTESEF